MLYLFLNIIMKMLEFTFLNPNIYYRTVFVIKPENFNSDMLVLTLFSIPIIMVISGII